MIGQTRKTICQLAAAVLLVVLLLSACASSASRVSEKIELGQKYLTELNYTEAVASFTEAIGLDPENIPAYMGRAESYKELKQYEEARADYTVVIEKTQELPYAQAQAYVGRAEVCNLSEDTSAAEKDCNIALSLLEQDNVGKKENIAEKLIREMKIRILQLHAEICMKLGWYDKAMEDYERLRELGIEMAQEQDAGQQLGGTYAVKYTAYGDVTEVRITVQAGQRQIYDWGVLNVNAEEMCGIIASLRAANQYPNYSEMVQDIRKLEDEREKKALDLNSYDDPEVIAYWQKWDAHLEKHSDYYAIYESELQRVSGIDWKPQYIVMTSLSQPVSRVEKTADAIYIYVPTGTREIGEKMVFSSYSGQSEAIDLNRALYEKEIDWSRPIYELDDRYEDEVTWSPRIEYREDT